MVSAKDFLESIETAFKKHEGDLPGSITLMAHGFSEKELVELMLVEDPRRSLSRQSGGGTLVFDLKLDTTGVSMITLFS